MNNLDKKYITLLQDILDNGVKKETRNGGTLSVFGRQIRHSMKDGFPLLTTKKMYFKGIVTELLWFLRGDTSIKYLLENDCNIWTGDAFRNYWEYNKIQSNPKWLKPVTYSNGNVGAELYNIEEFINKIKTDDKFARKWGSLGPVYGKQWRDWGGEFSLHIGLERDGSQDIINFKKGVDQISELIRLLKENPDSRRMVVSAWAVHDLPNMVLPPCHYGFQVYTRELSLLERYELMKKLDNWVSVHYKEPKTMEYMDKHNIPTRAISLMFNMRSTDVPLGLPFNLASYGLLLEIIAKEVNMVPDELIGNLGDTHIYLNQIEGIKEQLTREPFDLPKVLKKDEYHYLADMDIPFSEKIDAFKPDFWKLENYQSHPAIKLPLSN
jgi:thymidylate synthase